MSLDLDAIKARADAATPGPWVWGGRQSDRDLRSATSGVPIVMAFRRSGMQGAEPVFWRRAPGANGYEPADYAPDDVASPDAVFIAHSRSDISALAAEVERLRAELRHMDDDNDRIRERNGELLAEVANLDRAWSIHTGAFRVDV